MKRISCAVLLVAAFAAQAIAADVGVSVSVSQPGFYGQINIGSVPPPQLIFARPVIIERVPQYVSVSPIYLHVPPGHEKHWSQHCVEYHACGRPVYFVRDDWYETVYAPHGRRAGGDDREDGNRGEGHGQGRKNR
jgi:hypothetical protein